MSSSDPESAVTVSDAQRDRAHRFRSLHDDGIFIMPCAWDAGSAQLLAASGAVALGTTSGGVNWSRARPDYVYAVDREVMFDDYGAIAASTSLPVSGDLENGYGATAIEVGETITATIRRGMVGGSIEDQSSEPGQGLIPIDDAAERVAAARAAADESLPDFTITARAESFFGGVADPMADAIERANRYVEAGANCIFVPGPSDLATIAQLVESISAPISLGVGSGGGALSLADLGRIGVRRVSTGGALPRALYAVLARAALEMQQAGTFSYTGDVYGEEEINRLMS